MTFTLKQQPGNVRIPNQGTVSSSTRVSQFSRPNEAFLIKCHVNFRYALSLKRARRKSLRAVHQGRTKDLIFIGQTRH